MKRSAFLRHQLWIGLLGGTVLILAGLYVRLGVLASANHDEVEHLHVGFKMLDGLLPYRDFYQNHMPAYWLTSTLAAHLFPLSTDALLAARTVSFLAFLGCAALGLRLLGSVSGGRGWIARIVYAAALIALAHRLELYIARPDPVMTFFGTASLCLLPLRGALANGRAVIVGVLAGLAVAISPKIVPVLLATPAFALVTCLRARDLRPATALLFYGLGGALGLLPTVLWLLHHGLFAPFHFDVIALNRSLSKPWEESLNVVFLPFFVPAVLAVVAWYREERRRPERAGNGAAILGLWIAGGVGLAFFTRHGGPYNLQVLAVPLAVGAAVLVTLLWTRIREAPFRLLALGAIVTLPTIEAATALAALRDAGGIHQRELARLVRLARPGDRTCTAFSPWHPIFCRDVSGLSNGWDLGFAEKVSDPDQRERFRQLWRDGLERTIAERPDLIVRNDHGDVWRGAVRAGMLEERDVRRLEALAAEYQPFRIGHGIVWVRRDSAPAAHSQP